MTKWKRIEDLTFRDVIAETIVGNAPGDILIRYGQHITPCMKEQLYQRGVRWISVLGSPSDDGLTEHKPLISQEKLDAFSDEIHQIYDEIIEDGKVDKERTENLGKTIANEVVQNFGEVIIPSLYQLKQIDQYTFTHQVNVSIISTTIAMSLFPDEQDRVQKVSVAGLLHDVGKIFVPAKILLNKEHLSEIQFEVMKKHPDYGYKIAKESGIEDKAILDPIRFHHERWDGSGYNGGIYWDSIPLTSRIMSIADVYDALTTERPYKKAWPPYEATSFIVKESKRMFDPKLVNAFLKVFGLYTSGSRVLLSTKEEAIVIGNRLGVISRPIVSVIRDGVTTKIDLSVENGIRIVKVLQTRVLDQR